MGVKTVAQIACGVALVAAVLAPSAGFPAWMRLLAFAPILSLLVLWPKAYRPRLRLLIIVLTPALFLVLIGIVTVTNEAHSGELLARALGRVVGLSLLAVVGLGFLLDNVPGSWHETNAFRSIIPGVAAVAMMFVGLEVGRDGLTFGNAEREIDFSGLVPPWEDLSHLSSNERALITSTPMVTPVAKNGSRMTLLLENGSAEALRASRGEMSVRNLYGELLLVAELDARSRIPSHASILLEANISGAQLPSEFVFAPLDQLSFQWRTSAVVMEHRDPISKTGWCAARRAGWTPTAPSCLRIVVTGPAQEPKTR